MVFPWLLGSGVPGKPGKNDEPNVDFEIDIFRSTPLKSQGTWCTPETGVYSVLVNEDEIDGTTLPINPHKHP